MSLQSLQSSLADEPMHGASTGKFAHQGSLDIRTAGPEKPEGAPTKHVQIHGSNQQPCHPYLAGKFTVDMLCHRSQLQLTCMPISVWTAGQDRMEEAERQHGANQQSCSDMQTSMSGDANSIDAANPMQNSKDGKLIAALQGASCRIGPSSPATQMVN